MSTPKPHYGPNPTPKFNGYQEFFKEFIDLSSSPTFHNQLKDSIVHEIENVLNLLVFFQCLKEEFKFFFLTDSQRYTRRSH